jgi:translocator protein
MKKIFLPLLSVVVTIIISAWVSLTPFAGVTQKDISDKYYSLISPATFTFSIWSIIYLAWIWVSLLVALKKIKISKKENLFFSLSVFLTSLWLFPWHLDEMGVCLAIILIIIAFFLFLFSQSRESDKFFKYTIELSLWWILIATLANITVFLVSKGINIWITWLIMALGIWTAINVILLQKYKAIIPSFVFLWALFWIYIEQGGWITKKINLIIAFILILFILKSKFIKEEEKLKKKKK